MVILRRTTLLIVAALLFTLSGCAKFPTTPVVSGRQLVITMQVRGRINPMDPDMPNVLRHYFVAFDVDAAAHPNVGPLAALYPPYGGTGWVTSSNAQQSIGLTSFIQYDAANPQGYIYGVVPNTFFLNRTSPQPPIRYEILENGSALRFIVDLSQIATTTIPVDQIGLVNVNFIATNALPNANDIVESRQIDGLGPSGQDFVQIDTTQDRVYTDLDTDAPNLIPADGDIDIISWSIEVQTVSSR